MVRVPTSAEEFLHDAGHPNWRAGRVLTACRWVRRGHFQASSSCFQKVNLSKRCQLSIQGHQHPGRSTDPPKPGHLRSRSCSVSLEGDCTMDPSPVSCLEPRDQPGRPQFSRQSSKSYFYGLLFTPAGYLGRKKNAEQVEPARWRPVISNQHSPGP